ncbi:MAG TPA: hypothetical protein VN700_05800 [Vicinamibacterales bacterium]|nr:hypothetical protein [Vicinamibacterales bacterium]
MPSALDAARQRGYEQMAADFARVFGDRFVALVASPGGAAAAFVASLSAGDLDALGPLAGVWRHADLDPPLVMTPDEFRRSLDAFPLEYQSLLDHHVVIAGHPPFEGVRIQSDDIRRACEAQARGHLIHLRQGWIEHASHHGGLADLIADSAGALRTVLQNLARLHQAPMADDAGLADWAEKTVGMPGALVNDVLALTAARHKVPALVPRLPEYLAAAERLWAHADTWPAR